METIALTTGASFGSVGSLRGFCPVTVTDGVPGAGVVAIAMVPGGVVFPRAGCFVTGRFWLWSCCLG